MKIMMWAITISNKVSVVMIHLRFRSAWNMFWPQMLHNCKDKTHIFFKLHLVFLLSSWFERGSINIGHCSVFLFMQLVGFKTNKVLLCSRLLRINPHQCTRTIVTLASRV
jgi:hypothetical protein